MSQWLPPEEFANLVRLGPLVAIDLIIRDTEDCVLLGKRTNRPAQGWWFVPGGAVRKNERLDDAFGRILMAETGLSLPRQAARLLGAYEHFYPDNRFGDPGYNTHYVVMGHELRIAVRPEIRLDDQHSGIRWMKVNELLAAEDVHDNTKAYFR